MADNGKKEFPKNGLEYDVCSRFARRIYCYLQNDNKIKRFTKRKMNKRFRKRNRLRAKDWRDND